MCEINDQRKGKEMRIKISAATMALIALFVISLAITDGVRAEGYSTMSEVESAQCGLVSSAESFAESGKIILSDVQVMIDGRSEKA